MFGKYSVTVSGPFMEELITSLVPFGKVASGNFPDREGTDHRSLALTYNLHAVVRSSGNAVTVM